ncbi:hypothetical protein [Streptomyces eurythermus]|uniref:hypothetical protein n=1 Tax=Streptomyces eurythermus TaxID=42237 RepID=UPI0033DA44BA
MNGVVRDLPEDHRRRLVEDGLDRLDAIRRDPQASQVTRDLLGDLLAHRGIVGFTTGMPGTSLSPAGSAEKYSMGRSVFQGQGTTERLGSLAHELTHGDAGESCANTAILLLLRRGLGDDGIRRPAEERNAEIDLLRGLLEQAGGTLTAAQSGLVRAKLDYASEPQKGVGRYAASSKSHGKIDEPTYQYLMRVELLTAKKSFRARGVRHRDHPAARPSAPLGSGARRSAVRRGGPAGRTAAVRPGGRRGRRPAAPGHPVSGVREKPAARAGRGPGAAPTSPETVRFPRIVVARRSGPAIGWKPPTLRMSCWGFVNGVCRSGRIVGRNDVTRGVSARGSAGAAGRPYEA